MPNPKRALRRAPLFRVLATCTLACFPGVLAECRGAAEPPPAIPATSTPLEGVPFDAIGRGKIVFARVSVSGFGPTGVYVIDGDARTAWETLPEQLAEGPAVSPDGRRLAFTRLSDLNTAYDVYVANLDGTGQTQATRFLSQEGSPTWTPDGSKVLYFATNTGGSFNFYTQSPIASPTDLLQWTRFTFTAESPCWTLNTDYVSGVLSSHGALAVTCFASLYTLDAPGATPILRYGTGVSSQPPIVVAPAWSSDGGRVAFLEVVFNSTITIKVMNADGSNIRTVLVMAIHEKTNLAGHNNYSLCWTSDDERFFLSVPDGDLSSHIWMLHADGTGLTQITTAAGAFDRSVSCTR